LYAPDLPSFPTRRSSDLLADADAQDVVQNTFIYLSRRMPNFRYDPKRGSFKSWLRVVTRSRISGYRRKTEAELPLLREPLPGSEDRKSTRLNSSHDQISY